MMNLTVLTLLFIWWIPPLVIGIGLAAWGIVRLIVGRNTPGPSGIDLTLKGQATVAMGSWSQPPFTLTVVSNDPVNNPVGSRRIIFTVTALNPQPGIPIDFCKIVQASDPTGAMVSLYSAASIYSVTTTPAGTAQIICQGDDKGMVRIIANDVKSTETAILDYEVV